MLIPANWRSPTKELCHYLKKQLQLTPQQRRNILQHASSKEHVESEDASRERLLTPSSEQYDGYSSYPPGGISSIGCDRSFKFPIFKKLAELLNAPSEKKIPIKLYGDGRCKNALALRIAQLNQIILNLSLNGSQPDKQTVDEALMTLHKRFPITRIDRLRSSIRPLREFRCTDPSPNFNAILQQNPRAYGIKVNAFDEDAIQASPLMGKTMQAVASDSKIINISDDALIYTPSRSLVTSLGTPVLGNLKHLQPERPMVRAGVLMEVVHFLPKNVKVFLANQIAAEQKPGSLLALGYNELGSPLFTSALQKLGYKPVKDSGLDYDYLLEKHR